MALKTIKQKIVAVEKTHKVTRAMEAVSAVKMRKSQERAFLARPYALHAFSILKRVRSAVSSREHPLLTPRGEIKNILLVIVTADKGLAGNLNAQVLKECDRIIEESGVSAKHIRVFAIGKKAAEYAARKNLRVVRSFLNLSDGVSVGDMREVSASAAESFLSGECDECKIIYTHFISTLVNDVRTRIILPINEYSLGKAVKWARPKTGRFAHEGEEASENETHTYTFEPGSGEVLSALLPHLLNIELYHALLEAKASEHSARMVAMKNATERAAEVGSGLRLIYNKARQAAITREVSEIVSGAEASA